MTDLTIEKGVPIPRRIGKWKEIAVQMGVGDSVAFSTLKEADAPQMSLYNLFGAGSTARRRLADGTYRVWRLS